MIFPKYRFLKIKVLKETTITADTIPIKEGDKYVIALKLGDLIIKDYKINSETGEIKSGIVYKGKYYQNKELYEIIDDKKLFDEIKGREIKDEIKIDGKSIKDKKSLH